LAATRFNPGRKGFLLSQNTELCMGRGGSFEQIFSVMGQCLRHLGTGRFIKVSSGILKGA